MASYVITFAVGVVIGVIALIVIAVNVNSGMAEFERCEKPESEVEE